MKINRKAQIELGINWIFILVAGGLIIIFFLAIALTQQKSSEKEISTYLIDSLYQSMTTGLLSERYYNELPKLGNFDYNAICLENLAVFYFNKVKKDVSFLFFSPTYAKQGDAIIWGIKWKISYPLSNIIYLTFTTNKIIIINESTLTKICNNLKDYFHEKANVKCVNSFDVNQIKSELQKENIDSLTVVSTRDTLTIQNLSDAVSLVKRKINPKNLRIIVVNSTNLDRGEVSFILNNGQSSYKFLHYSELIGAIVSGDPNFYSCMLRRRARINQIIIQIYLNKVNRLKEISSSSCASIYSGQLATLFNEIIEYENTLEYLTNDLKFQEYYLKMSAIEQANKNLIWNNCELII
ncbi:MAG: hypothetical protein QXR30_01415 [Candidatus Woesearchaeota archaeon]